MASGERDVERFLDLLSRFGAAVDLIGPRGQETAARLAREAVLALPHLPAAGVVLDIGSGNGFPVVPLLLARRELRAVCLEPRERRWAFLREVARELGLAMTVVREDVGRHAGGPYDAVTCRALAGRVWLPAIPRLVAPGGRVFWWAGAGRVAEATEAGCDVVIRFPLPESGGLLHVWHRRST